MNYIIVNKRFKIQKSIHARAESSEKVAGNISVLVTRDTFPLHTSIKYEIENLKTTRRNISQQIDEISTRKIKIKTPMNIPMENKYSYFCD